ncbi:MAG TPA: hypothetical protein PKD98_27405 [Anaerolineae bacterium]|nr:hypothetical protein [Anaerolineae bacterium]
MIQKSLSLQPLLKVKTHLKAGADCPVPEKAYRDGYDAGQNDAQRAGPKSHQDHYDHHHNDYWWE